MLPRLLTLKRILTLKISMAYFLTRSQLFSKSYLYVYMLAVLLGDDLIIIKIIKYLYSASILCRLQNVLRGSIKPVFPVFSPRGTGRAELRHLPECCCNIMVWIMCSLENFQVTVLSRVVFVFTWPNVFPFSYEPANLVRMLSLQYFHFSSFSLRSQSNQMFANEPLVRISME